MNVERQISKKQIVKNSLAGRFRCETCNRLARVRTGEFKNGLYLCWRCKRVAKYSPNERRKQLREIAKEIGRCPHCLKDKDNPLFKLCSKCRKYMRDYNKKRRCNDETIKDND